MKKIKFSYISIIIVALIFTSCGEDFLKIPREGAETSDTYFRDQETAEELITANYNIFLQGWPNFYWEHMIIGGDVRSDDGVNAGDPAGERIHRTQMDLFDIYADNEGVYEAWEILFAGVGRANFAIETINEIPVEGFEDEATKNRLIAEARALRAMHFSYLVKLYGKVPLANRVLTPEEADMKRAELDELFDLMESDLEFAIAHLNWKANTVPGHVTKGFAMYLLTNILIYEAGTDPNHANWQKAYDISKTLIEKNEYVLIPFGDIWLQGNDFNDETIFEIVNQGGPTGTAVWYTIYMMPRFVTKTDASGNESRADCWGWGVNAPTQDLVDAFETNGKPGDADYWEDPRLKHTVWREGEIVPIGENDDDNKLDSLPVWLKDTPTGYYRKKCMLIKEPTGDYNADFNPPIYRYADLILYHAEAAYYLGKENEARDAVNIIRERAREGQAGVLPDINSSGEQLLLDIWHERRVELAMEHHRFFDLVRQGRAAKVMKAHGKDFEEGKHELYPIPEAEILLNPNLEQNPGY
jgi:hypothetical protein